MARDFYRECTCARRVFEEASEASGLDLAALCSELLHPERAGHTTCNATGQFYLSELTSLVEALAAQASGALRWADNMRRLCEAAERIYEVGPSEALASSFSCLGRRTIAVTSLRHARAEVFS